MKSAAVSASKRVVRSRAILKSSMGTRDAHAVARPARAVSEMRSRMPRSGQSIYVYPSWSAKEEVMVAEDFKTSFKGVLPEVKVTVEQWGDPALPGDRTVVIMPSFSHGSHVASSFGDPSPGWWESVVGPGKYIDTNHFRVICASILGSPFGSTCPTSVNPRTGAKYGREFPSFSPVDQARVHGLMLDKLGVGKVHAVVGSSLGGMQALQFATEFPGRASRLVAISATGKTTPGTAAIRHVQRQAIMADPAWHEGRYVGSGPVDGLRVARMMGMLGYRSRVEFDSRFEWRAMGGVKPWDTSFEVESYLSYQGSKFSSSGHFDANSYLYLSKAMDLQDLGNPHIYTGRTMADAASKIVSDTLLVSVDQDTLIPPTELESLASLMRASGNLTTEHVVLDSIYGHDAFLKEDAVFGPLIQSHLEQGIQSHLEDEKRHTTGLSGP